MSVLAVFGGIPNLGSVKGNDVSTLSTTQTLAIAETPTSPQVFGRGRLSDLFGDFVIYRSLEPLDARLPGFKVAQRHVGLAGAACPRKQEKAYASVATWIVEQAQQVRGSKERLHEMLYVGDTLYNDSQAFRNMVSVSGWRGACFIGAERSEQTPAATIEAGAIYSANRWSALGEWAHWLRSEGGMRLDGSTAVIVDIDKTALGAKGRNDRVIDNARLCGAYATMTSLLGEGVNIDEFEKYYSELNRTRYHNVTEDNQDYLAYICVVLSTGLVSFEELMREVHNGSIDNFEQFIRQVESRMMTSTYSEALRQAHDSVIMSVRNGDPTPFKRFRRQEFICTIERMGNLPDDAGVDTILAEEITLTQEVWELADWLKQRGCLLLCLSDKPDEASRPNKHVSADLPAVHRAETHRVGASIRATLDSIG